MLFILYSFSLSLFGLDSFLFGKCRCLFSFLLLFCQLLFKDSNLLSFSLLSFGLSQCLFCSSRFHLFLHRQKPSIFGLLIFLNLPFTGFIKKPLVLLLFSLQSVDLLINLHLLTFKIIK